MAFWKLGAKTKLKKLLREEYYAEIELSVKKHRNVLVDLADLLNDTDTTTSGRAARVLCWSALLHLDFYFKELDATVGPRVLGMLEDGNPHVRQDATFALSGAPSNTPGAVANAAPPLIDRAIPQLIGLLEDIDHEVQRAAGHCLCVIAHRILRSGRDNRLVLDIQSKLADHRDVLNRADAASFWMWNAKAFRMVAEEARPILLKLAKDSDERVRRTAEEALTSLATSG